VPAALADDLHEFPSTTPVQKRPDSLFETVAAFPSPARFQSTEKKEVAVARQRSFGTQRA